MSSEERANEDPAPVGATAFPVVDAISKILTVAVALGAVGFAVGNWHPLWGEVFAKMVAEPNTPERLQLGYEHGMAGAVLGLILGTIGTRRP